MSGFVAISGGEHDVLDDGLLDCAAARMAFRGPHGAGQWRSGSTGLAHARLDVTKDTEADCQPRQGDNGLVIVADARIDGRADLLAALAREGTHLGRDAPDSALVLAAYRTWGEDCLAHLVGDFAFVIWDAPRRTLFCARDHFGVKPCFYAERGGLLMVANTLACVRLHPHVGTALDDQAVADYLLFEVMQEADATIYADIRRLPAGHKLTFTPTGGVRVRRYWRLPLDGEIRYPDATDYVAHFDARFEEAVSDRLRTDDVGVSMSGGLDSTSVAAVAKHALDAAGGRLRAHTTVYDRALDDDEGHFARMVAERLGIPITFEPLDDALLFEGIGESSLDTCEPTEFVGVGGEGEDAREFPPEVRVVLTGFGGDAVLRANEHYVADLLAAGRPLALARGVWSCLRAHGRRPALGLRSRIRACLGHRRWRPAFPAWLDADLTRRLRLRERFDHWYDDPMPRHPYRPDAYAHLDDPFWAALFEDYDPGFSTAPVEYRHPLFDVRLVSDLLAMPPVPWFVDKALLREAMRGRLPEAVRIRPKTVLAGAPPGAIWSGLDRARLERLLGGAALGRYVSGDALREPGALARMRTYAFDDTERRLLGLAHWLAQPDSLGPIATGGEV